MRGKRELGGGGLWQLEFCVLMNSSVAHKNVFASAQKYAAVFRVRPEGVAMAKGGRLWVVGGITVKVQSAALEQLETMHLIDFERFKQTREQLATCSRVCSSRFKKQTH